LKRYRALFLGGAVPEAAAAMRGWLSAGHEIAEHWIGYSQHRGMVHRDARLAHLAPQWSTAAVTRTNAIPTREVPPLVAWDKRLNAVRALDADVLISVYFPFLVPPDMLDIFGGRAVNLHPAPLPRYRGPTPIYAMILDGKITTDATMTLHVMSTGFDTGDIIANKPIVFPENRNLMRLSLATAKAGRALMAEALPAYLDGRIAARPQDEGQASYVRLTRADLTLRSHLDSQSMQLRCDTIGRRRALGIAGLSGVRVSGFDAEIGPATGAKPGAGPFSVEMDAADRRVRLVRKRPWSSLIRRVSDLAILAADRDKTT
jgi:folate-dependent phosphoribosylglycinamide formyltransferase PurN